MIRLRQFGRRTAQGIISSLPESKSSSVGFRSGRQCARDSAEAGASAERPLRIAVLDNIVAPYRVPLYQRLGENFSTWLLLSGSEDNRQWHTVKRLTGVQVKTVWGMTFKRRHTKQKGVTQDVQYVHVNPGYVWELLRLRPDVIITTEMGFRSAVSIAIGRVIRKPVLVWWGGTVHTERNRSRMKRWIRRRLFAPLVQGWLSYGRTSTEYLTSIGVNPKRVEEVQNTVDDHLYLPSAEPIDIDMPRPRALFVGQLIGRKGLDQLLSATAALQREGQIFSLIIAGDGPEAERFKEEANRLGIDHLLHLPYVPPVRMPSLYTACDFLVFPTLEDVWGLVVNEALLCGLPVIASTHAGCAAELLDPDCVFDPQDHFEFVETYRRALNTQIPPASTVRVQPLRVVADAIADAVRSCAVTRAG